MGIKEWSDLLESILILLFIINNHLQTKLIYRLEDRIKALEEKENQYESHRKSE